MIILVFSYLRLEYNLLMSIDKCDRDEVGFFKSPNGEKTCGNNIWPQKTNTDTGNLMCRNLGPDPKFIDLSTLKPHQKESVKSMTLSSMCSCHHALTKDNKVVGCETNDENNRCMCSINSSKKSIQPGDDMVMVKNKINKTCFETCNSYAQDDIIEPDELMEEEFDEEEEEDLDEEGKYKESSEVGGGRRSTRTSRRTTSRQSRQIRSQRSSQRASQNTEKPPDVDDEKYPTVENRKKEEFRKRFYNQCKYVEDSKGYNLYSPVELTDYKRINSYDKKFGCLIDQNSNVKTKQVTFVDIGKCKIEQDIINEQLQIKIDIDSSMMTKLYKKYSYITLPNKITWKGYSINYFLYDRYTPGFGAYFTAVEPISLLNRPVIPNINLPENSLDKLFPDLDKLEIREIDYSILGGGGFDFSWFTNLFSGGAGFSLGKDFIFTCKFLSSVIFISMLAFLAIRFLQLGDETNNIMMAAVMAIIIIFVTTSPFLIVPKV